MVLLQTIILKLILTACLGCSDTPQALEPVSEAFSRDIVVLKTWEDTGTLINFIVWLPENKPFYINFGSDEELESGITCSYGAGFTKQLFDSIKTLTNQIYVSNYYNTTEDRMRGEWTCYAYYRSIAYIFRSILKLPSITIIIDVRVDIDECNTTRSPCGPNANCTNTFGSYDCTCFSGYEPNGKYCQDVNECLSNPCSDYAKCHNEVPGYRCTCRPGFTGDGHTCSDVDECNANHGRPCSPYANCTNTIGSYECTCLTGYAGNGIYCQAPDEGINLKLVVIIVVAVAVVAAVAWLMVVLHKRRQRREKAIQSELNCESLENTTERSMPTPPQSDNYSPPVDRQNVNITDTCSVPYQERNIDEMYAKPLPKALRKPPNESLYAELSSASVEQKVSIKSRGGGGARPARTAFTLSSSKGTKCDELTYGNLSHHTSEYSQIQPKILTGNPNTPKLSPTESPYAEVLPKSMRPNKEPSCYVNVFDTQRYVNYNNGEASRDRSDNAELAYCEIGFKK